MTLKFANRQDELKQICSPAQPPLMIIDAPAGYGKTTLLQEVKRVFEEEHKWKCALVELDSHSHRGKVDIAKAIADQIGSEEAKTDDEQEVDVKLMPELANAGKLILLFDAVERAKEEDLLWLLEFVRECKDWSRGLQFRAVFAGRYTHANDAFKWIDASMWLGYHRIPLTPFTDDIVREVLEQTAKEHPPSEDRELQREDFVTWAKHVMRLSGGHPRSIEKLVAALRISNWTLVFSLRRERSLFKKYVDSEVTEITKSLDDNIKEGLKTLSVFRHFTFNTIQALQDKGEFSKEINPRVFFAELTNLGLIAKSKNSPFYTDEIIRNLLLAQIRILHPQHFEKLNRTAQEIYDEFIDSLVSRDLPYGPLTKEDLVPIYVRESIYHSCRRPASKLAIVGLARNLRQHSDTLTTALGPNEHDPGYRKYLENMLMSDEEIRSSLEDCGLSIPVLWDLAFGESLSNPILENGGHEMLADPNAIKVIIDASTLLVEIVRDVFRGRQAQRQADKALEEIEKAKEPSPVASRPMALPVEQPDELEAILQQIDLVSKKMKVDSIDSIVTQLANHRRAWNDYCEEESRPTGSAEAKVERKQRREDEEKFIHDKSLRLKQLLEEITGRSIELPELE